MAQQDVQRKLTAILSADVKGYSRLMGDDEAATINTLTAYREVFSKYIEQYRGRVVNAPGDALLAEFASVVDAVGCAVEIQRELAERNEEMPADRRMEFRIGINLGDVVVKGEDIYGDGVNIAARLESLAEGGGICISGSVYDSIHNKLPLEFEFLGEQSVKNIKQPVRTYRVLSEPGAAALRMIRAKRVVVGYWRVAVATIVAIVVLVGGGFLGWRVYQQRSEHYSMAAFAKRAAFPIPDQPSIAVLAFDNLSGDPLQEYIGDGISENIITRLARIPAVFVVARNSSFVFKGKPVSVKQVGQELGVRYVVEGSFQKSGNRIRITAQLIDAATGQNLWADSYDREAKEMLQLMDEITRIIVTELNVKITFGEGMRFSAGATDNLEAYDLFWQATALWHRYDKEANARSRKLLAKAIKLDPNYARAMALLGRAHQKDSSFRWVKDTKASFRQAEEWARKALAVNEADGQAHALLSEIHVWKREYQKAISEGERAVEVEPGHAGHFATLSWTLNYAGYPERAITAIQKALRLSPYAETSFLAIAADPLFILGRYEEAKQLYEKILARSKGGNLARFSQLRLIGIHMDLGEEEKARALALRFLELEPDISVKRFGEVHMRRPYKNTLWVETMLENLRKAGLPE